MRSIFQYTTDDDLKEYLVRCKRFRNDLDIQSMFFDIKNTIKYHKQNGFITAKGTAAQQLWYESLERGQPDYSLYDSEFFIGDVWTCWVAYSRKYLLSLNSPKSLATNKSIRETFSPFIGRVADLGCGLGYSTAALKELFPLTLVYGTNIRDTCQWRLAEDLAKYRNFSLFTEIQNDTDLVFASEYFEHIENPIEHLEDVIRIGRPKVMVFANAFRSKALGHFNFYKHRGQTLPNTCIGRLFSKHLRESGYKRLETKLWNNRPDVWVKI
jgi:SAM-dependent methyltransferase